MRSLSLGKVIVDGTARRLFSEGFGGDDFITSGARRKAAGADIVYQLMKKQGPSEEDLKEVLYSLSLDELIRPTRKRLEEAIEFLVSEKMRAWREGREVERQQFAPDSITDLPFLLREEAYFEGQKALEFRGLFTDENEVVIKEALLRGHKEGEFFNYNDFIQRGVDFRFRLKSVAAFMGS